MRRPGIRAHQATPFAIQTVAMRRWISLDPKLGSAKMKNDFNSGSSPLETGLDDLAPGTFGEVVRVDTSDATGRRLQDLGLLPHTRVRALSRAPLGDPGLYELRGYRLCLRGVDARRVRVRVESDRGPEGTRLGSPPGKR
jgi:ferrous iron transport protein A